MGAKNVIILRTVSGIKYACFIAKEINLRGLECQIASLSEIDLLIKDKKLDPRYTLIHSRTASPYTVYDKLKELEKRAFKIINNPETIKLTSEKYISCVHAEKNKIASAKTVKIKKSEAEIMIKDKMKEWGSIIVKPITSKDRGEYCFKLNENNIFDFNKIPTDEIIIQKFVNYTRLNRIIVIGFKALEEAVTYDEPLDNWKCTVCLNPNIKHYKNPPKELLKLAEEVAIKFNSELAFIDIFTTKDGYVLNEINTACNLIHHERITGVNISKHIADYLISKF
jgi:glutathione synthase/RimK-type ligase-like ATP-grasp enzyme